MKIIILLFSLLLSIKSFSQVKANPGVSSMKVTEASNVQIDENNLPMGSTYRIKIPISNSSTTGIIPSGSCKLKIGLGSKLNVASPFNLTNAEASQYFEWTATPAGGQVQITGDLKSPLPQNFFDTLSFDVVGSLVGVSTVTSNFLVTNHNTAVVLSDEDGTNNYSFLSYTIVAPAPGPVPVTFTDLSQQKNKCAVKIIFGAENEINVKKYEIEISKDGVVFNKIGELDANKLINYSYNFNINNLIAAKNLFFRIKSLDLDGRFQYSPTKLINGLCTEPLSLIAFPNPVNEQAFISVKAINGLFNGKYNVNLYDAVGKLITTNNYQFLNNASFNFPLSKIACGQYLLKIVNQANEAETFSLRIQKK